MPPPQSIYLFEKGSEMGMDWWMYLLSALVSRALPILYYGLSQCTAVRLPTTWAALVPVRFPPRWFPPRPGPRPPADRWACLPSPPLPPLPHR